LPILTCNAAFKSGIFVFRDYFQQNFLFAIAIIPIIWDTPAVWAGFALAKDTKTAVSLTKSPAQTVPYRKKHRANLRKNRKKNHLHAIIW